MTVGPLLAEVLAAFCPVVAVDTMGAGALAPPLKLLPGFFTRATAGGAGAGASALPAEGLPAAFPGAGAGTAGAGAWLPIG